MPVLSDFRELSTVGIDIDRVRWGGQVLRAKYGDGFEDKAVVGSAAGLHGFSLSSNLFPDDAAIATIETVSWFEYYYDFFKEHITGSQDVFVLEWRGDKWHVSFAEDEIDFERMTNDLFAGGVTLKQRRVRGMAYKANGAIFDPSMMGGIWAWYNGDEYLNDEGIYIPKNLVTDGVITGFTTDSVNIVPVANVVNGRGVYRFNAGATNNGYFFSLLDPVIYEAAFLMKINEATFSTYGGILTADAGTAALIGDIGTTKFFNVGFGAGYTYKKNGVSFVQTNQQAPMNVFGVVHIRFPSGIPLTNLQIGKDRADAARFAEMDLCEWLLGNAPWSDADAGYVDDYLMKRGDITA